MRQRRPCLARDRGYEWLAPPVTFGHEAVGRVTAVGPGADEGWMGKQIVPISIDGCGRCRTCERGLRQICPQRTVLGLSFDGAAAESFTIPEGRVVPVEVDLSPEILALTEPVSVAYRAVRHLERSQDGAMDVVVSGPGPIGLTASAAEKVATIASLPRWAHGVQDTEVLPCGQVAVLLS